MRPVLKKLVNVGVSSVGIVIPKKMADQLGITRDSYVIISLEEDKIVIRKANIELPEF